MRYFIKHRTNGQYLHLVAYTLNFHLSLIVVHSQRPNRE
jgi:hypothetical protein